ncbi:putative acetyl-coenzyme A synthetase 2-like, mitochondrial [Apostichopus japonicus]|uniref:acetate--CoA ligase n=1 Tax=Stichopus japonicus TaxID=307972 RepID=A0A2G8JSG1_STIJA|nr:putative acetyl-coenzyme A synthetase 2-like, mitochondrial [Apostichopus japonicus]
MDGKKKLLGNTWFSGKKCTSGWSFQAREVPFPVIWGVSKQEIFLYAARQPMVALRLDSNSRPPETGAICISPRPSAPNAEIRHGPMRPFFGINPQLLNEDKQEIQGNNVSGALCIKQPWPGLARTIYGNHERFVATYLKDFPGYYSTGDGAHRDVDGYYHITGRMDDVINVTGHRLGTAEVEDAMDEHEAVAETAVVGFPHDIKGEGVYAYVILKDGITEPEDQIIEELKAMTKKKIAGYAVPEVVLITPGLPKTRSGKIMRRILRKICAGEKESLGDTSTLADPSIVDTLIEKHEQLTSKQ